MSQELLLRFSHNIVEHLGLKLYQNQPTRVIAELVSNSWDADATTVQIQSQSSDPRWVSVADNGHGMDRLALQSAYLVIGHPKRKKPTDSSPSGRPVMGRKGIGKLAAFGIAKQVDLVTAALDQGKVKFIWLRFNRDQLLNKGDGDVSYKPDLLADGLSAEDLPLSKDDTGQVKEWLDLVSSGTGTLVLMSHLSIVKALNDAQLLSSLGSRFTVATGGKISISVNGVVATDANSLPSLEFRIPAQGKTEVEVSPGRSIKYWAGFVRSAEWPQDQAGVGVYAHGKIAQDRPFVFGVKGKEIFSRYMLAFVEADWLDELDADLISTDRTSINWDAPEVADLHAKGQELARDWLTQFEKWRQEQEVDKNRTLVKKVVGVGAGRRVTETEEEEITRLVSTITPSFDKADEAAKEKLVAAVSDAWVQKPMRKLVKDLWESFSESSDAPPQAFTAMVEKLSSHSVPESLNLAVIFGQRAFALTRLHDYVHHGIETDLQLLLEKFPWIIEPDSTVLTANESLKKAVLRAEELGQLGTGRRVINGIPDANRPDFVFLSSPKEFQIVVVELKSPQLDLTTENVGQLQDYMFWLGNTYPDAEVRGYLIGRNPANLTSRYDGTKIIAWTEVLERSRARNLELLAAMLLRTGSTGVLDARSIDAVELGGKDAKVLLDRLAEDHSEIRSLMETFKQADGTNQANKKPKD